MRLLRRRRRESPLIPAHPTESRSLPVGKPLNKRAAGRGALLGDIDNQALGDELLPKSTDLGKDGIGRLMLRLAVPAIAAQVINALYNIVDRMYIGNLPGQQGTQSIAALGVSLPLIVVISAFGSLVGIGGSALALDLIVVTLTILLGAGLGRLLKMDRDTALLTSIGSSICGAAAVLGAEPVVKSKPYKAAVAVSTVVIFGTLSMFLYPALHRAGILDLTPEQMGLFTGATLHEVAHVVGAGNAMGQAISDPAIIVKMIRVMMLAPVLVVLSIVLARRDPSSGANGEKRKITIPWFAFLFLAVIGFNSLHLLPAGLVDAINTLDTFLLTMAMTALGAESSFEKFKKAGARPFLLAGFLYIWLFFGGYWLVKLISL